MLCPPVHPATLRDSAPLHGAHMQAVEEPPVHVGLRIMKPGGGTTQGGADTPARASGGSGSGAISSGGPEAAGGSTSSALGGAGRAGSAAVGDGGLSWRLKALKRAQEQAAAGAGSLGSLVAERWGSLSDLTGSLTEGRAADSEWWCGQGALGLLGGQGVQAHVARLGGSYCVFQASVLFLACMQAALMFMQHGIVSAVRPSPCPVHLGRSVEAQGCGHTI